jgi:hypothetical protein
MLRVTRRRGQRGAVAVEAALITPLLIVLLFGIIEFGLLFKDYLGVTSAARAGVRTASSEPRVGTFAQDAANQVLREGAALDPDDIDEVWVYDANAQGFPDARTDFVTCVKCYRYRPNAAGTAMVAYGTTTWSSTSMNACAGDPLRDQVGVYIKYEHPAIVGLFFDSFTLMDHSVMSLEPVTVSTGCK